MRKRKTKERTVTYWCQWCRTGSPSAARRRPPPPSPGRSPPSDCWCSPSPEPAPGARLDRTLTDHPKWPLEGERAKGKGWGCDVHVGRDRRFSNLDYEIRVKGVFKTLKPECNPWSWLHLTSHDRTRSPSYTPAVLTTLKDPPLYEDGCFYMCERLT